MFFIQFLLCNVTFSSRLQIWRVVIVIILPKLLGSVNSRPIRLKIFSTTVNDLDLFEILSYIFSSIGINVLTYPVQVRQLQIYQ